MQQQHLIQKIKELKQQKNAIILGHYYQRPEIQDLSDYIGDSLALAQQAAKATADIIVFCGVHFMAETAKILNPTRKVLIPDMAASCSLAESCDANELAKFKAQHPDHIVISYINCSAAVKAESDIICTSGNAEKIVASLPADQKIIFAPDRNLGSVINKLTGRNMLLWDGTCYVHNDMQASMINQLKELYPEAKVIAHPECNPELLNVADFIGSTKAMLTYVKQTPCNQFIVATESGILHQMQKENPDKRFITFGDLRNCACDDCKYMKLNTLEKLYACLDTENPEIIMQPSMIEAARKPIEKMLEISKNLGIIR